LTRRIRSEALDPQTRQALVALAAPEPVAGPPTFAHYHGVLGAGGARQLFDDAVVHEAEFVSNEPHGHPKRQGWVLADPPPSAEPVTDFVRSKLAQLSVDLGLGFRFGPGRDDGPQPVFSDVIVTAHGDGDFLGPHHDDGWPGLRNGRLLSFVYWFHSVPRRFEGGQLTLSGWRERDGALSPIGPKVDIDPEHDSLVVFPSCTRHELRVVRCPPGDFAAARFALVGFIRRR
jgi:2OG-Fe(II) oxygenase superfamily